MRKIDKHTDVGDSIPQRLQRARVIIPAKAREYVFTGVGLCVCLSVTTIAKKIVDGFVPNFMGRFLEEREGQVRVSLRSVEGCGSNSQKTP